MKFSSHTRAQPERWANLLYMSFNLISRLMFRSSRQQVSNWSMTKENHDPSTAAVAKSSPSPKSTSRLMQQKSLEKTHHNPQHDSPKTAMKSSSDLFELLERCQSQRLDDQRCVLPSYFSQVSKTQITFCEIGNIVLSKCIMLWLKHKRRALTEVYDLDNKLDFFRFGIFFLD